jgi:hypothetical protein
MYGLRNLLFFENSPVLGEDDQSILEKFVVIKYDMSSATDSIDEAKLELFARKHAI